MWFDRSPLECLPCASRKELIGILVLRHRDIPELLRKSPIQNLCRLLASIIKLTSIHDLLEAVEVLVLFLDELLPNAGRGKRLYRVRLTKDLVEGCGIKLPLRNIDTLGSTCIELRSKETIKGLTLLLGPEDLLLVATVLHIVFVLEGVAHRLTLSVSLELDAILLTHIRVDPTDAIICDA